MGRASRAGLVLLVLAIGAGVWRAGQIIFSWPRADVIATVGVVLAAAAIVVAAILAPDSSNSGRRLPCPASGGPAQRLRVPITPISEVDPTLIGVDPAAQTVLTGGRVPSYVPRKIDATLRDAVAAALEGRGQWFVVIVGPSKVGKSRVLFEALRGACRDQRIWVVAPLDGEALRSLLNQGEKPLWWSASVVLWLDDLEPFINQGVTYETLREWHAGGPGRIIAATYGGKGSDLLTEAKVGGLATVTSQVLQHACEFSLGATTAVEVSELLDRLPLREVEAIQRHGLAAYLVAGPALERKLNTGRHAPGEGSCWEGVAVVHAAIDWALCGRTDSISHEFLRQLWPAYLPTGSQDTDEAFETALDWALRPVAGTVALLQRTGSYRAYDYVVRVVGGQPDALPPGERAWKFAIDTATGPGAFGVAIAAYQYARLQDSERAFMQARQSTQGAIAARAGVNLAIVLGELRRFDDALAAYDEVVVDYGEDPRLQVIVAEALFNKAHTLQNLGRSPQAVKAYNEVVTRYDQSTERLLLEQVAKALVNKGVIQAKLVGPTEAIEVYDYVVSRFSQEPALSEHVARALVNKSYRLGELGRLGEAVALSEDVVARFGEAEEPALREQVARALVNKGYRLGALAGSGEEDTTYVSEAIGAYDEVITRFSEAEEPALLEQVATALFGKGVTLGQLGRRDEEVAAYDEVVARFGGAEDLAMLEQVAKALVNKGSTLRPAGDAIVVYDEVVERFGEADDPALREQVAKALVGKGIRLGRLGHSVEASAAFDQALTSFGDAMDAALRVAAAQARASLPRPGAQPR